MHSDLWSQIHCISSHRPLPHSAGISHGNFDKLTKFDNIIQNGNDLTVISLAEIWCVRQQINWRDFFLTINTKYCVNLKCWIENINLTIRLILAINPNWINCNVKLRKYKLNLTMNHAQKALITRATFLSPLTSALSVKILTKINWIAACLNYSQFHFVSYSCSFYEPVLFVPEKHIHSSFQFNFINFLLKMCGIYLYHWYYG